MIRTALIAASDAFDSDATLLKLYELLALELKIISVNITISKSNDNVLIISNTKKKLRK